jgi:hypothetical protein
LHRELARTSPYALMDGTRSPRSLRSLCIEVLAAHIPELAGAGDTVLPWLPLDVRLSLLAIAKRRKELTDEILNLLIDEHWTTLDLSGAGDTVSIPGVVSALSRMPNLQFLDISGLDILGPRFIIFLAKSCPALLGLRIGLPQDRNLTHLETIGDALIEILPGLNRPSTVVDSWESVAESLSEPCCGTLSQLECLNWPDIPPAIEWKCLQIAPKVYINPTDALIAEKQLPRWYDGKVRLDAQYLWEHSSGDGGWIATGEKETRSNLPVTTPVIHIAEKFRLAYESRDSRLKRRDARLRRQQIRKYLLSSGSARAIREWECEY